MSANLEVNREDRVLRIVLNRPEKRNALSWELCRELVETFTAAERDPRIAVILLSANGSVFCSGMDLNEAAAPEAAERGRVHEELFTIGARLTVPIVAAINGPALGGGLGLVANTHVGVAVQGASFGLTEIRLGMWPFVVHRTVSLALGERRALELSLTGRIFGTQEALSWGLVHHVVPAFELDDRTGAIATGIAGLSRDSIRRGMSFVHQARGRTWDEVGALAHQARSEVFQSAAFREGVAAFREKRKPNWPA